MVVYIDQNVYEEQLLPLITIKGQSDGLGTFMFKFYVNMCTSLYLRLNGIS